MRHYEQLKYRFICCILELGCCDESNDTELEMGGPFILNLGIKNTKNTNNSYFLMSVASLYTPCFVMFFVFLYGPFCHGAVSFICEQNLNNSFFQCLRHNLGRRIELIRYAEIGRHHSHHRGFNSKDIRITIQLKEMPFKNLL